MVSGDENNDIGAREAKKRRTESTDNAVKNATGEDSMDAPSGKSSDPFQVGNSLFCEAYLWRNV